MAAIATKTTIKPAARAPPAALRRPSSRAQRTRHLFRPNLGRNLLAEPAAGHLRGSPFGRPSRWRAGCISAGPAGAVRILISLLSACAYLASASQPFAFPHKSGANLSALRGDKLDSARPAHIMIAPAQLCRPSWRAGLGPPIRRPNLLYDRASRPTNLASPPARAANSRARRRSNNNSNHLAGAAGVAAAKRARVSSRRRATPRRRAGPQRRRWARAAPRDAGAR